MDPQAKCLKVKLFSEANTGYFYTWKKNPKAYPWRIALRKYDPIVRRHVLFKVRVLCVCVSRIRTRRPPPPCFRCICRSRCTHRSRCASCD